MYHGLTGLTRSCFCRGPNDHINIGISHSCSKGQCKGDTGNHVMWDPYDYAVFWGLTLGSVHVPHMVRGAFVTGASNEPKSKHHLIGC